MDSSFKFNKENLDFLLTKDKSKNLNIISNFEQYHINRKQLRDELFNNFITIFLAILAIGTTIIIFLFDNSKNKTISSQVLEVINRLSWIPVSIILLVIFTFIRKYFLSSDFNSELKSFYYKKLEIILDDNLVTPIYKNSLFEKKIVNRLLIVNSIDERLLIIEDYIEKIKKYKSYISIYIWSTIVLIIIEIIVNLLSRSNIQIYFRLFIISIFIGGMILTLKSYLKKKNLSKNLSFLNEEKRKLNELKSIENIKGRIFGFLSNIKNKCFK